MLGDRILEEIANTIAVIRNSDRKNALIGRHTDIEGILNWRVDPVGSVYEPRKTPFQPVDTKMRAVTFVKIPGQDPLKVIVRDIRSRTGNVVFKACISDGVILNRVIRPARNRIL